MSKIKQNYTLEYYSELGKTKNMTEIIFTQDDENTCSVTSIFSDVRSLEGYRAIAFIKSSQGNEYQQECIVTENKVVLNLDSELLRVIDRYYVEIILRKDNERKSTVTFIYTVKPSIEGEFTRTQNNLSILTRLENDIKDRYTKEEVDNKIDEVKNLIDNAEGNGKAPIIFSDTKPSQVGYFWVNTSKETSTLEEI